MLFRSMLGPHDREDAELGQVGLAPERMKDALIFVGGEAVLGDQFGRDGGHGRRLSGAARFGQRGRGFAERSSRSSHRAAVCRRANFSNFTQWNAGAAVRSDCDVKERDNRSGSFQQMKSYFARAETDVRFRPIADAKQVCDDAECSNALSQSPPLSLRAVL